MNGKRLVEFRDLKDFEVYFLIFILNIIYANIKYLLPINLTFTLNSLIDMQLHLMNI